MHNLLHKIYYSKYTNTLVWFLAAMFYSLQMTLRILPIMMIDYFTQKFSMDAAEFGMLAGCYYLGYAGMQIPIGILLDKYHPRYVISGCILICISGILMTIYSETKIYAYLARLLIGVGSAAGILGAVKSIDDFFPKKYSMFLGFTVFCGVFGAFYGGAPIGKSIKLFGIEETLMLLVYIALGLSIALLLLYRKSYSESKNHQSLSVMSIIKSSLLNKRIWFIGFLGGLMVGPMGGFADTWGSKYLIEGKNIDSSAASDAISLIFLGLGLGSSITGYIAQKFRSLSKLIACMGIAQIIVMLILFSVEFEAPIYVYSLTLLMGILSSYQIVVFALANKLSTNHTVGVVTSLVNSMIMFFCFFFNYGIGAILKLLYNSLSKDRLVYNQEAFHGAFTLILFCIALGIIGFISLIRKEKALKI